MDSVDGLKETLDALKEWKLQLSQSLTELDHTEKQLQHSAKATEEDIKQHFTQLEQILVSSVRQKCTEMLKEVSFVRAKSTRHLLQCRKHVEGELSAADRVLEEGCQLLQDEDTLSMEQLESFRNRRISDFGSLPEVPSPSEIGNISASFDPYVISQLTTTILQYGSISTSCPVIITHCEERPGAVMVHWIEPEDDMSLDEHEYRLQHSPGDILEVDSTAAFEEAYRGQECSNLVRDIKVGTSHSFRVCCRVSGKSWSAWSPPFVTTATIPHYEWDDDNMCYSLTNDGRIATRNSYQPVSIILSKDPLYRINQSILFKFLEVNCEQDENEGIALTLGDSDSFIEKGSIFLNMEGCVFVEGRKVMTHLPAPHRGSEVTFDLELVSSSKVRITVGSQEKQVTYDLRLSYSEDTPFLNLRFGMFFQNEGWKVAVE